ncbi:hypothetical protein P3W53_19880 [Pseudomonas denitrificans (nom. rej.)]|nr:hypothetical protein [Pseudomonas denitrificans (nom. rej.)]
MESRTGCPGFVIGQRSGQHLDGAQPLQSLPVPRMAHDADLHTAFGGELRQVLADGATGPADQQKVIFVQRQLVEGLLGGQCRAGKAGGTGKIQGIRQAQQNARGNGRVLGKTARLVQILVIGHAPSQPGLIGTMPDRYHNAGAIDARDFPRLPIHQFTAQDFPIHRVKADGGVAYQDFTRRRHGQRAALQLQPLRLRATLPGPGARRTH